MKGIAKKLFESREISHMMHLNSDMYSKHICLEEYYTEILILVDKLVETYSGQYELLGDYMKIDEVPDTSDVIKYFQAVVEYMSKERYIQIEKEDTHLQSIVDDVISLLYRTIYKLKYLK